MKTYTVRYALYDQAYDVGNGYYWTWKDADLSQDSLIRFYKSISDSVPMNANTIKPEEIERYSGHKEFEGAYVIYRFYNGGTDRVGRPNRCIILTAWLEEKEIEGQQREPLALSAEEVSKILQLPTFTKLENPAYAKLIPIPAPWTLSEQFPSAEKVLQEKYDILIKTNKELEDKKKELEKEVSGLRSKIFSLESDKAELEKKQKELKEELAELSKPPRVVTPPMPHTTEPLRTTNTLLTHCKFVGQIPPPKIPVKNCQEVAVSYELEVYGATDSFSPLLCRSKIGEINNCGDAALETGIPIESLINRKIEIQLAMRVPGYEYVKVVEKYFLGIFPYTKELNMTQPEEKRILLIPGEPTFK